VVEVDVRGDFVVEGVHEGPEVVEVGLVGHDVDGRARGNAGSLQNFGDMLR